MRLNSHRSIALFATGLGIALLIALFSPLASTSPDGLERVAEDKGFMETAKEPPFKVIADYAFPWVGNEKAATVLAGMAGALLVAGMTSGLAFGLQRIGKRRPAGSNGRQTAADSDT